MTSDSIKSVAKDALDSLLTVHEGPYDAGSMKKTYQLYLSLAVSFNLPLDTVVYDNDIYKQEYRRNVVAAINDAEAVVLEMARIINGRDKEAT